MIVLKVCLLWFVIGFIVASFNQLLFRLNDRDLPPREIIFAFSIIGWPIALIVDLLVVMTKSMTRWLNFLADLPNTISARRYRRQQIKSKRGIEA